MQSIYEAMRGFASLRIGSTGPRVQLVQLRLRELGYGLKGTGYFGPATDVAVEAFQRKAGLAVDGEVGPRTAKALDDAGKLTGEAASAGKAPLVAPASIPLWLQVSLDHVGMKEAPGAANNKELIADIRTVAKDYQNDATPWCAGWVSFCLARAGEKPSSLPLWAQSYADTAHQPIMRLAGPAVGAIAVKTRTGGGHVTFVAGRTRSGALACCGGNQNDMVNVSPYAATAFNLGFFWPQNVPLPQVLGVKGLPIVSSSGIPIASEA